MEVTRALLYNWQSVAQLNRQVALRVVAWGNGAEPGDVATHLKILLNAGVDRLHCLGLNINGTPCHPHARGTHRIPDNFQPILYAQASQNAVPTGTTNQERLTEQPTERRNS
jgi:hypothetical protein